MLVVVVEHERRAQRGGVCGKADRERGHGREPGVDEVVGHVQRRVAEVFDLLGGVAPDLSRHARCLHAETELVTHGFLSPQVPASRETIGASWVIDSLGTTV